MTAVDRPRVDAQASLEHLRARLDVVTGRVAAVVARRRSSDPDPDDRFRGLYVGDEHVDRLLAGAPSALPPADPQAAAALAAAEEAADRAEAAGADLRLRRVARAFGLDELDVELLLVALAPDLDVRFERFYGYLNDDVTRRRATTALALELCGVPPGSGPGRRRLGPEGALVRGGLVRLEDTDRPFVARGVVVPDRVVGHLVGDDTMDPLVASIVGDGGVVRRGSLAGLTDRLDVGVLAGGIAGGAELVHVRERSGAAGVAAAVTALAAVGLDAVVVDLTRLDRSADVAEVAAAAAREARLCGAGLVAAPLEVLAEGGAAGVRAFADAPGVVVLVGNGAWDPAWSTQPPLSLEAPVLDGAHRAAVWRAALDGRTELDDDELAAATAAFRLTPEQVRRAATAARGAAAAAGRSVTVDDLQAGARGQNAAGLERLARRVRAGVGWDDLVLPADTLAQLRELAARARHRDLVLDDWGMGATSSKGRGVSALFAGDSGTGKTMSAEVIAGDLGLDLYVIDLSTVIDKYVGETEKNLDRILSEAERVNGVLLFDEADALFGKRSEVSDARDRYANVEVAYLLQRMEAFDGVAILTTNLRANVDEAFTRRLDAIVDFPTPQVPDRLRLWRQKLRAEVPRADDIDFDFLASAFQLSGGEIRNIAVTAAYLAAAEARPVTMADLVRATEREYRKLGRLCLPAEFGRYFPLLSSAG